MLLLSEYVAAVEARVQRETHSLATGSAQSYEDYRGRVGFIKGLNQAVQILQEIVQKTPMEERS